MNAFPLVLYVALALCQHVRETRDDRATDDYAWSRCYEDLGCLNNTREWYHPIYRPVKAPPLDRHIIKTTFYLFTKSDDKKHLVKMEQLLPNIKQIKLTKFKKSKRTHILIHDFTSTGLAGWIRHMVRSIVSSNLGNALSVDWTGGAEPPYYMAVQNARLVGLELAYLLKLLIKEFGVNPEELHFIGMGVGAHIAGYATAEVDNVARITGLDPNGLYFKDMPCSVHLDPGDAKFVDVIYTDVLQLKGQGSSDTYGHVNFYANGALTQPGCNSSQTYTSLNQFSRDSLLQNEVVPGCNHKRAAKYFSASIDEASNCTFIGYRCNDYLTFTRGECIDCRMGQTCAPMGYHAVDIAKNMSAPLSKFFLITGSETPFCLFGYRIVVQLLSSSIMQLNQTTGIANDTVDSTEGIFRAIVSSKSEGARFQANLNVGPTKKPFVLNAENAFLTFQKGPKLNNPDKLILRYDSNVPNAAVFVSRVEVTPLPSSNPRDTVHLCGSYEVTKFVPHTQEEFTLCTLDTCSQERAKKKRPKRVPDVFHVDGTNDESEDDGTEDYDEYDDY